MRPHREKEPFIHKGDKIVMERAAPGGVWDVLAARWASDRDDRIEIVLGRGGSNRFKTVFNAATMRHQSNWPQHMLSRDINVGRPLQYKPRRGA